LGIFAISSLYCVDIVFVPFETENMIRNFNLLKITMKQIIPLLIACAIFFAWLFRWDMATVSNGSDRWGGAYLLDRWTGAAFVLHGANKIEVKPEK